MRPKKIYLNNNDIERVRHFTTFDVTASDKAKEGFTEYTDLSQVRHPNTDIPDYGVEILFHLRFDDESECISSNTREEFETICRCAQYIDNFGWDNVLSWAYISDIFQIGGEQ